MAAAGNYIVESDVDNWPDTVSQTTTFATTDVNITNEQLTIGIDVATGSKIRFSSTGALPAPLVDGTLYYAIRIGGTIIKVALNPVNAAAGTAVNLTDVGTGTHTVDVGEGSSTVDRQEVIDRAEQKIENITRDFFYPIAFDENFNGNGKDRLFLGFIPDILIDILQLHLTDLAMVKDSTTLTSITGGFTAAMVGELIYISAGTNFIVGWYTIAGHTDTNTVTLNKTAATAGAGAAGIGTMGGVVEIKVAGVVLETSWWTFDKNSVFLDPEAAAGAGGLAELHLRLKYETILFPRGMANIKIIGICGWSSCPVAIKKAAIILCRSENDPTLYSQHENFQSEKIGDYSYTLGNKKFLTGISQADILLKEYIRNKPIMGAV